MFVVHLKDDTPVYMQLQNQILDYIALGILQKDDQLPSVRTLSKELGINPNTVAKAYTNLELLGYVYTKPAKGVFVLIDNVKDEVFEKKLEELSLKIMDCKKLGIKLEDVIQTANKIYEEVKKNVED